MQRVCWPGAEAPSPERSVVTLGVFDGVHLGHRAVIQRVMDVASERSVVSAIVTFDRHPASVLSGGRVPSITSLDHRIHLFERLGIGLCVVVRFGAEVAAMSAAQFARAVFRDLLRAEVVVLGFNSRFGRHREGDAALCRQLGAELDFQVVSIPPVAMDGVPVSSTSIREAILVGDLDQAGELLGRPFSLYGTVVRGDDRGRRLGRPTANLDLHNETVPPDGVYACWALLDGRRLPAVTSIGRRRTFHYEPDAERVVEVHVIDYAGELYGQDIEVQFAGRLRGQEMFGSAEELKAQMACDVRDALRMTTGGGENA